MNIGEVLDGVYDDDIGWRPATGAIKPVHVANGLIRALQGHNFDLKELHSFVVSWRAGKVPDEKRSFEALKASELAARLGFLVNSQRDFERTRRYALGLLGTDRALFPSADHSAYSLTSGRMATRDTSDRGLGTFAASLLEGEGGETTLADVVRARTSADWPEDPITALVWPLLPQLGPESAPKRTAPRAERNDGQSDRSRAKPARRLRSQQRAFNRPILTAIREAAASLASHEQNQGNRLHTIQRAVSFACVATHSHAQALAGGGDLDRRPPALLSFAGPRRGNVASGSERSLDAIYSQFERWLGTRLAFRLRAREPLAEGEDPVPAGTTDGRSIRALLGRIGTADSRHLTPTRELVDARYQNYAVALREFGPDDPELVLGHALVRCYVQEFESGGPRPFLQGLGRKVGLLYPHFQGRAKEKRVRPSVPILDMLVRACIPAGAAIELDEFLERLWIRFGLIVGGRRNEAWDDASYLHEFGVPVDTDDLDVNTATFIDQMNAMGLARRYPDGVTFVGDGHAA